MLFDIFSQISSEISPLASPRDMIWPNLTSMFENSVPFHLLENSITPIDMSSSLIGNAIKFIVKVPNLESRLFQSCL